MELEAIKKVIAEQMDIDAQKITLDSTFDWTLTPSIWSRSLWRWKKNWTSPWKSWKTSRASKK